MSRKKGVLKIYLLNKHTKEFRSTFTEVDMETTFPELGFLTENYTKQYLNGSQYYREPDCEDPPGPYIDEMYQIPLQRDTLVLLSETEDIVVFKAIDYWDATHYPNQLFRYKDEFYTHAKGWIVL